MPEKEEDSLELLQVSKDRKDLNEYPENSVSHVPCFAGPEVKDWLNCEIESRFCL